MKTNSLLTYLLYALLAVLILGAGYKACQMQKEKQEKAREQAEWDDTIRKLYPDSDSLSSGSSYVNSDSTGTKTAAPSASGIEDEKPTTTAGTGSTKSAATTPAAANKTPTTTTTKPKTTTTTKGGSTAAKGAGVGRYSVQAGAFSSKENARDRLEELIKMGYTNAEIGTSGKYHVVVVMRTNDKAKAIQVNDQLERRGVDAQVMDKNRKN